MKCNTIGSIAFLLLLTCVVSISSLNAQSDVVENPEVDTTIILDGTAISVDGNGVSVVGNVVTIGTAGTFSLNGTLTDGQIVVDSDDDGLVTLVLDGVNLSSSTSAPINIKNADEAAILLADATENYISDAAVYVYENAEDDEPNAAVFSDDDLTIYGTGSLTVTGNFNDGIASKDTLTIIDSTISITSVDDGIRGKDYRQIDGAAITVDVKGDGLKSDNDEDEKLGYIMIENGVFNINAGGDAIQAETTLNITNGDFTIVTSGGNSASIDESLSAKGLKADVEIIIDGGLYNLNTADDGIHTNDSIVINSGMFALASGDDAIHADATIEINGGNIDITESYEGIESAIITINDGTIHIVSSDDGINVAGDEDRSSDYLMSIDGGYIVVDAEGDGLDANGSINMSGGVVIVNGPTQSGNGALDYDIAFQITGGELVAVGNSSMLQAPDTTSTQYSLAVGFDSAVEAGTPVNIQNSAGKTVLTFVPAKTYQAIVFSSPELVGGETYTIYQGGSAVGTITDGLYSDETYTNGTAYTSLTLSGITTQEGGSSMGRGGGRGRP